jgi:hypothetical protein
MFSNYNKFGLDDFGTFTFMALKKTKKIRRDLCSTKKFERTCMPLVETLLPSMPLPSDLGQIVEEKVQNTIKAKCAIIFFEHFNNFK